MSRIAVVLDIGGTVINPDFRVLRDWVRSKTATNPEVEVVERAFRYAVNSVFGRDVAPGLQGEADRFFEGIDAGPAADPEDRVHLWNEIVNSGGNGSWLYTSVSADCRATLRTLRARGAKLVAASNSDGTLLDELTCFELDKCFDLILDSRVIGAEKPHPAFYQAVLEATASERAVHVGDDLLNDFVAPGRHGFDSTVVFDPCGLFPAVPSSMRVSSLSDILRGDSW